MPKRKYYAKVRNSKPSVLRTVEVGKAGYLRIGTQVTIRQALLDLFKVRTRPMSVATVVPGEITRLAFDKLGASMSTAMRRYHARQPLVTTTRTASRLPSAPAQPKADADEQPRV